jgi:protein required for attachment to host cells
VFEDENPLTHEQGSERPGRVSKALESSQRSAVEPVDWHQIEEHRFAKKVAAAMEQVARERRVPALVVVAPPRTLADLRHAFHVDVRARIIGEIDKDLTKHPVAEIERQLTSAPQFLLFCSICPAVVESDEAVRVDHGSQDRQAGV